ncbi:MAG: SHOCT domain-containing protein [Rhodoferax sp.]|uniref:SHOCT domain-containing protein n=1 Tax=Rhodoferax sp. TaxID=50421 RepID=UPI003262CDF3
MKDMLNKAKTTAIDLVATTASKITDAAKDNKPTPQGIKRAADFLADTARKATSELSRLGKDALKTDMAKDAAAGAAIGAAVAVPIPFVGPIAGAVVGAGLGVYKNIRQSGASSNTHSAIPPHPLSGALEAPLIDVAATSPSTKDRFEELTKLYELKVKGVLTEEEFASEKQKILNG